MLHPTVTAEILVAEIEVATERLGDQVQFTRTGTIVDAKISTGPIIRFDGSRYDAEPYDVAVVDAVAPDGRMLPGEAWPPGLNHGHHPILGRPFICIRGTGEYHLHPSHLADPWDAYRGRLALADLAAHILRRMGL